MPPKKQRGPYRQYLEEENEFLKPRTTIQSQNLKQTTTAACTSPRDSPERRDDSSIISEGETVSADNDHSSISQDFGDNDKSDENSSETGVPAEALSSPEEDPSTEAFRINRGTNENPDWVAFSHEVSEMEDEYTDPDPPLMDYEELNQVEDIDHCSQSLNISGNESRMDVSIGSHLENLDEQNRFMLGPQDDKWEDKHNWEEITPLVLRRSKFEILLGIFHIVMRHGSFKGRLIRDLLKFVNTLFDRNIVPESEFLFRKLFTPSHVVEFHFFCNTCNTYFGLLNGPITCRNCHAICEVTGMNKGSFFLTLSVKEQLQQLFLKEGLKFLSRSNRSGDAIKDIVDGSMYQKLCKPGEILADENALSITFNTDGAPVFQSRTGSIWPIQLVVNEIVPEQRFDSENTILCGLWFGKKEPDMTFFLNPFIDELNELGREGINRNMPNGQTIKTRVYPLLCCVDSVAKPKLQNIKQFNGRFGCGYCYHPNNCIEDLSSDEEDQESEEVASDVELQHTSTQHRKRKRKKEMRYKSGVTYPYRSHEEMKRDMLLAEELDSEGSLKPPNDHVNGLKGISSLLTLMHFNVVFGFVIDYMHNVLAGVTQRLTELICHHLSEERLQHLNKILRDLTPPQNVLRKPRPLSERSDFKCKEWRNCLLFYFLPLLKDELPQQIYDNLSCLVISIFILLKKSITTQELNAARELLELFVSDFNAIFGDINMVYNVHLLTHLVDIVEMWGPLWAYSAFTFESGNGNLLKLMAGSTGVATQICEKYCLTKSVTHAMAGRYVSSKVLHFCSNIMNYKYVKQACTLGSVTAFGVGRVVEMTVRERNAFLAAGFEEYANSHESLQFYNRVILSEAEGNPFYSAAYDKPKVYNDTCVLLTDSSYAITEKFVLVPSGTNDEIWVLVRGIQVSDEEPLAPHIKICAHFPYSDDLRLIQTSMIRCKAIHLTCKDKHYVMNFPNFYEKY